MAQGKDDTIMVKKETSCYVKIKVSESVSGSTETLNVSVNVTLINSSDSFLDLLMI